MTTSMNIITMPFGKHKGMPIDELPDGYLVFAVQKCKSKLEPLINEALKEELDDRIASGHIQNVPENRNEKLTPRQREMLYQAEDGPIVPETGHEEQSLRCLQGLYLVKKSTRNRWYITVTGHGWLTVDRLERSPSPEEYICLRKCTGDGHRPQDKADEAVCAALELKGLTYCASDRYHATQKGRDVMETFDITKTG